MDSNAMLKSFLFSLFLLCLLFVFALLGGCALSVKNGPGAETQSIHNEKNSLIKSVEKGDYVVLFGEVYLAGNSFSKKDKSLKLWRPGPLYPFRVNLKDERFIEKIIKSGTKEHKELFFSFI